MSLAGLCLFGLVGTAWEGGGSTNLYFTLLTVYTYSVIDDKLLPPYNASIETHFYMCDIVMPTIYTRYFCPKAQWFD